MAEATAKKPIRVLVVGTTWPPTTFLGRLMRGLADEGLEVRIAFATWPDEDWFLKSKLQTFKTRAWSGPFPFRLAWLAWLLLRGVFVAPRVVRTFWNAASRQKSLSERLRVLNRLLPYAGVPADVIYFPWNSAAIDYLPLFEMGKPVVVSCRGSQVNVAPHDPRRSIREGLPLTFRRASLVHCVSRAIQAEAGRYGLEASKARVIRTGVDPNFFSPSASREPSDVVRIVTTGRLEWTKGLTYGLQALRHVVDAGVPVMLSIIGDGPERQRILFAIDDLGLGSSVRLLGRLAPIQVRDELRRSDIFVLPSLSEGLSNAAVEAMGCGLPIVLTDCGGAREAVADGREGFVVPLWDPAAMGAALLKLARDPELRLQMGRAARERVLREFVSARHVREFVQLFEESRTLDSTPDSTPGSTSDSRCPAA
jgi:colanic acid/amylovoran biosynthesis glycosyltransferase